MTENEESDTENLESGLNKFRGINTIFEAGKWHEISTVFSLNMPIVF